MDFISFLSPLISHVALFLPHLFHQDIGSSVLNGALSTFLAVAVLLFSTSYVFKTLATQFALTVGLGVLHGLVLLPVMLSIFGPKPYASAEPPHGTGSVEMHASSGEHTIHLEKVVEDNFAENAEAPTKASGDIDA